MNQMTTEQALNLIRETTAQLNASLQTHQAILQAISILQDITELKNSESAQE